MRNPNRTLTIWRRLANLPGGRRLFSALVCWKAPYFGSIDPRFLSLRPHHCEVSMKRRRKVLNHIGTVHAIAMCNLAELAAGTMTDATVPANLRWIPKGMTVAYLKKAETALVATATIARTAPMAAETELPVRVAVTDANGQLVFEATITMWLSRRE